MPKRKEVKLQERYEEPTFLVDFAKEDIDFGVFCNGVMEIERRPDGTKIIRCEGRSLYIEPKKGNRPRIWEVSEP